mmetsp:Transcript_53947/g.101156  ORF Transcript_53947/g.101156 Transcript_53947/m.101156 type:complete len:252 (-) Transcript_53947:125-880(-)
MGAPPTLESMDENEEDESEGVMDFCGFHRSPDIFESPKHATTPCGTGRRSVALTTDKTPPAQSWRGPPWPEPGAQAQRKRSPGACEDGVAALLPKMKRMRLRPSIGQLRLQREAEEDLNVSPQVKVSVEPELLKATVAIECAALEKDSILFELSFPPQYPHRPPSVAQVSPERQLPIFRYAGGLVVLPRLREWTWSSVSGIADVVRDLLEPFPGDLAGVAGHGKVLCHQYIPHFLNGVAPEPPPEEDVEMS